MGSNANVLDLIDSFLAEWGTEKKAETGNDTQTGGTAHPVTSKDDNTQNATEGSRSAENTSDVKDQVGSASVETTDNPGDGEPKPANSGTEVADADETPGNTPDPKSTKENPLTELAGMDAAFNEKYSSVNEELRGLGNSLLAKIAVLAESAGETSEGKKAAAEKPDGEKQTEGAECKEKPEGQGASESVSSDATESKDEDEDDEQALKEAEELGYQVAEIFAKESGIQDPEQASEFVLDQTVKEAMTAADAYADYFAMFAAGLQKAAMDEGAASMEDESEDEDVGEDVAEGASSEAAEGAAEDVAAGGGEGEDLGIAEALTGAVGAEEAPMEGEAGMPGGAEEQVEALAAALAEAGISPEELAAMVQDAEGAAPGAEEAAPMVSPAAAEPPMELTAAAKKQATEELINALAARIQARKK